jgi:HEAT repeat protein
LQDPGCFDPTEGEQNAAQLREWASEECYPVREAAKEALQRILSQGQPVPDTYGMKANADVAGLVVALRYGARDELGRLWGALDDPELAPLLNGLRSAAALCREHAASSLWVTPAAQGNPEAIRALVGALSDPYSTVRSTSISALAALAGAEAVEPLSKVVDDEDPRVRERAVRELGVISDPLAVKPLIRALEDWVSEVRRSAAWALGRVGGEEAVAALTVALDDLDESVRKAAREALEAARPPEESPAAAAEPEPTVQQPPLAGGNPAAQEPSPQGGKARRWRLPFLR